MRNGWCIYGVEIGLEVSFGEVLGEIWFGFLHEVQCVNCQFDTLEEFKTSMC